MVLNKLPAKVEDPGGFSIPCLIRNISIDRALCGLNSSVSSMPYFIFKKLNIRVLQPTAFLL